jgi:hypothetical protein
MLNHLTVFGTKFFDRDLVVCSPIDQGSGVGIDRTTTARKFRFSTGTRNDKSFSNTGRARFVARRS